MNACAHLVSPFPSSLLFAIALLPPIDRADSVLLCCDAILNQNKFTRTPVCSILIPRTESYELSDQCYSTRMLVYSTRKHILKIKTVPGLVVLTLN